MEFLTFFIFFFSAPHIGHVYTAFLSDVVARWHRLLGNEVIFTTGTDEHGLKIQQAAALVNTEPKIYCDQMSEKFRNLFTEADISYTDYIRTTEDRHVKAVQEFWKLLESKGYIYKGSYEGWYCVSDETFLSERDIKTIEDSDGNQVKVSVDSEQPVVWTKEDNYMFKLSEFSNRLIEWYDTNIIYPDNYKQILCKHLEAVVDLSVSRQRSRLTWGIPVPGDETQTIYVWLDALVNYLTVVGYPDTLSHWPPDCHVVGKDIIPFHAIYWPAFLMAADLPLPKKIICHGHWLSESVKMSKSRGNVIDPLDRINQYTAEGLKLYLLAQGPFDDCNYMETAAVEVINNHLVNVWANLLSRSCGIKINPQQMFPALNMDTYNEMMTEEDKKMFGNLYELADKADEYYKSYNINKAIDVIFDSLRWANTYFHENEPWKLVKMEEKKDHLNCVLHVAMETLRVCSILLQPVAPKFADKILNKLNIPSEQRHIKHTKSKIEFDMATGHKLGTGSANIMGRIKN